MLATISSIASASVAVLLFGCEITGARFQQRSHIENVFDLVGIERGHVEPAPRFQDDEALRRQPVQRFADRQAADAELPRDLLPPQACPACSAPEKNHFPQAGVGRLRGTDQEVSQKPVLCDPRANGKTC